MPKIASEAFILHGFWFIWCIISTPYHNASKSAMALSKTLEARLLPAANGDEKLGYHWNSDVEFQSEWVYLNMHALAFPVRDLHFTSLTFYFISVEYPSVERETRGVLLEMGIETSCAMLVAKLLRLCSIWQEAYAVSTQRPPEKHRGTDLKLFVVHCTSTSSRDS